MKTILFYLSLIVFLTSCEKEVDVNVSDGEALIYLDAWINDKPGVQEVKLLRAVNYMSQNQPEAITDARISVVDVSAGKTYDFEYTNGSYIYDAGEDTMGIVGHEYRLEIDYNGELFRATDVLKRTIPIDSLTYEFREEETGEEEGYYASFYARDAVGAIDYYWIRTYKNGKLNSYVSEMLSIDGSFYEEASDGFVFIEPFRDGITSDEEPYQKGDEVKVVVRSLSKSSHGFMDQLLDQLYSGGLFSKILANVPSNIKNSKPGAESKIYGWFGTVAESEASVKIQ